MSDTENPTTPTVEETPVVETPTVETPIEETPTVETSTDEETTTDEDSDDEIEIDIEIPVNFEDLTEEQQKEQQQKLIEEIMIQKMTILTKILADKKLVNPLMDTKESFKKQPLMKNIARYLLTFRILQNEIERDDTPEFVKNATKKIRVLIIKKYNKFFSPYIRKRLSTNGIRGYSFKKFGIKI